MKYLILVLLLVSGIAHGQIHLSDPYVPDTNFSERHRQQLEQRAFQREQQLRQQFQHEQHMRQLERNRYKGTDPFGRRC